MKSGLRTLITTLSLDDFVADCHRRTALSKEHLKDAVLEVLAAMLSQEERFEGCFDNEHAFLGYVRKSAIRRAVAYQRAEYQQETEAEQSCWGEGAETPEQQVLGALDQQSFLQLIERTLPNIAGSKELLADGQQLIRLIIASPDRFIHKRKSGKNEGVLVFHYIELARALGWNKQRVYDRLERIRKAFVRERKREESKR